MTRPAPPVTTAAPFVPATGDMIPLPSPRPHVPRIEGRGIEPLGIPRRVAIPGVPIGTRHE
jgi:hypothetical protein